MALHMLEWLGEMELKIAAGNQWNSLQVIAKAVTDCQQKATQWIPHAQKPLSGVSLCPQTGTSTISPSTETSSHPLPLLGIHHIGCNVWCCWATWVSGDGQQATEGKAHQLHLLCLSCSPSFTHPLPAPCQKKKKQVKPSACSFTLSFAAHFPVLLDEIKPWITSNNYFAYCSVLNLETVYFLNNYF